MSDPEIITCALLPADKAILKKIRDKALFAWARLYVPITGEVLSLRSPDRSFKDPAEFSFSDM
jgi:hypothetical protein